jgi:tRNA threonylcarbamoyladenosine biosynthesis protein TsaE
MIREGDSVFREVTIPDLPELAHWFLERMKDYKVWLLKGEMGSGKTTLVKAIGNAAHVKDVMSSPTFAIVNEYERENGTRFFHFDFYRIKDETEAYDIGVDEYFYSGYPCFIEWPEKIPSLIPPVYAEVNLQVLDTTRRTIVISFHDGKEENRV